MFGYLENQGLVGDVNLYRSHIKKFLIGKRGHHQNGSPPRTAWKYAFPGRTKEHRIRHGQGYARIWRRLIAPR